MQRTNRGPSGVGGWVGKEKGRRRTNWEVEPDRDPRKPPGDEDE